MVSFGSRNYCMQRVAHSMESLLKFVREARPAEELFGLSAAEVTEQGGYVVVEGKVYPHMEPLRPALARDKACVIIRINQRRWKTTRRRMHIADAALVRQTPFSLETRDGELVRVERPLGAIMLQLEKLDEYEEDMTSSLDRLVTRVSGSSRESKQVFVEEGLLIHTWMTAVGQLKVGTDPDSWTIEPPADKPFILYNGPFSSLLATIQNLKSTADSFLVPPGPSSKP